MTTNSARPPRFLKTRNARKVARAHRLGGQNTMRVVDPLYPAFETDDDDIDDHRMSAERERRFYPHAFHLRQLRREVLQLDLVFNLLFLAVVALEVFFHASQATLWSLVAVRLALIAVVFGVTRVLDWRRRADYARVDLAREETVHTLFSVLPGRYYRHDHEEGDDGHA